MKKIHFMSAALMAILVTSISGLPQASAIMGTDVLPINGAADFYEVIDGSGSITQTVFDNDVLPALSSSLAAALADPDTHGNVRVTVIQFASTAVKECQVMIDGPGDITTLTDCIDNDIAYLGGGTNIAGAYDLVTTELNASPLDGPNDRSIVDLVTDGNHNPGAPDLPTAFNAALAAGLDSSVVLGVEGNEVLVVAGLQALVFPNPPGPLFDPLMAGDVLPDPLVQGFVIIIDGFDEFEDTLLKKLDIIVNPCDSENPPPDCFIGGEFLPIDSTALLIAGAQTNAVWLLSALAVIGSVAFSALYLNSRKQ